LKSTIDHTGDHAPSRHRGFGGKFKATGIWFVPDETFFIEKKAISSGIDLIRINRIKADELADFIESVAQVDSSDALDGGVDQEGFHKIRVYTEVSRQLLQPTIVS